MLVDILFLVQFTLLYLNTGESAIKASFLFENLKFIDHEIECLYKKNLYCLLDVNCLHKIYLQLFTYYKKLICPLQNLKKTCVYHIFGFIIAAVIIMLVIADLRRL